MIAAYVIGVPGAGKSTLLRALTEGLDVSWERRPFAHAVYYRGAEVVGAQLGGHDPRFPGTDRLSMSVHPLAIEVVGRRPWPVVVAEGDRLATPGFLNALAAAADRLDVVYLDVPEEVAAERRAGRGSAQNEQWLRGRRTKIERLALTRPVVTVDGTRPVAEVVAEVGALPAFAALGGMGLAESERTR